MCPERPNILTVCPLQIILNDRTIHMKHDFTRGVNVENAAHPCVAGPCAHGGSCRPRKEGYECDCPLGFEGLHCQKGTHRVGGGVFGARGTRHSGRGWGPRDQVCGFEP